MWLLWMLLAAVGGKSSVSLASSVDDRENLGSTTVCERPDGTTGPCGPGNDLCHAAGYGDVDAPQYHLRDYSCAMNDPAAVVYDPKHGVYHDHWEDHLAMPGGAYVRGHAVSRDFVHWAHMPASLWNDQPYDDYAIFTGSATVVNGQVVQVYPGLCNKPKSGTPCPGGTNLAIAVPANGSDPLQTNWTKDGVSGGGLTGYVNPIVNNTQRDPSTAWQTPAGEWRLTTYDTRVYGSMDFKSWYDLGPQKDFTGGECPSFFPLPKATPGAGPAPAGAGTPTHVHKASYGGRDWMGVGTYSAGPPRVLGSFKPTPGVPGANALVDAGAFYASKDFYDPVKQRRILLGWAKIAYGKWNDGNTWDSSCHTLPREITWHPELQQLVFAPVEEQASLRGAVLGQLGPQQIEPGKPVSLGLPASGGGNQSELVVSFKRPTAAGSLTVTVMQSSGTPAELNHHGTAAERGRPPKAQGVALSFVFNGSTVVANGRPLKLSPSDSTLDLRVFSDHVMVEAYWMGGRLAATLPARCAGRCDVSISTTGSAASLLNATAWAVQSPWVSPEHVAATPRLDGGDAERMAARIHAQQRVA